MPTPRKGESEDVGVGGEVAEADRPSWSALDEHLITSPTGAWAGGSTFRDDVMWRAGPATCAAEPGHTHHSDPGQANQSALRLRRAHRRADAHLGPDFTLLDFDCDHMVAQAKPAETAAAIRARGLTTAAITDEQVSGARARRCHPCGEVATYGDIADARFQPAHRRLDHAHRLVRLPWHR
jgi:hypothetical protein